MWHKFLWISIIAIGLTLANTTIQPVLAQDGPPTSVVIESPKTTTLPWYAGVIFFVGVAVGVTILKERIAVATKKPHSSSSCCLPLVEDGSSLFQIYDDSSEQKT